MTQSPLYVANRRRRPPNIGVLLGVAGSDPDQPLGIDASLFKINGTGPANWRNYGVNWYDPVAAVLRPGSTIVVHEPQGQTSAGEEYRFLDMATASIFGNFSLILPVPSSPGPFQHGVYGGGLKDPSGDIDSQIDTACRNYYMGPYGPFACILDDFTANPVLQSTWGPQLTALLSLVQDFRNEPLVHNSMPATILARLAGTFRLMTDDISYRAGPWPSGAHHDTDTGMPPVYVIINNLPAGWAVYSHASRVAFLLAQAKIVAQRSPTQIPIIPVVGASPDTGLSPGPDTITAYNAWQGP